MKALFQNLTLILVAVLATFTGLSFYQTAQTYASTYVDIGTYSELDNGLKKIYKKFGVYQTDEVTISENDIITLDGETYVTGESVAEIIETDEDLVSVSDLEDSFTVTEEDNEIIVTTDKYTNRIMVYYEGSVNAYNTSIYAEGEGWHIYQYSSQEDTLDAYSYYENKGYTVYYDYVITAAEDSEELEIEASATNTSYLSWGASYTGVSEYNSYLSSMYSTSELSTVYVAILDTGINTGHSLFSGRISSYSRSFVNSNTSNYEDENGHGSHVAGIIANQTQSNVQLIVLQVLDSEGGGSSTAVVSAIQYLQKNSETIKKSGTNVNILMNMSLGIESTSEVHSSIETYIKTARSSYGILSVVAAGNGGSDNIGDNTIYCSPGNTDEAIVIAALYKSGTNLYRASYSNYGSTVDFSAPGSSVYSAYKASSTKTDVYETLSGTSMATPHASAVIALLYSNPAYSSYSCDDIEELLILNANYIGTNPSITNEEYSWDKYYGYGCINIANISTDVVGTVEFSSTETTDSDGNITQVAVTLSFTQSSNYPYYVIYYTTDGSTPSTTSSKYSSRLTISETKTITAVAYIYTDSNLSAITKKSETVSQVFYVDNYDIDSNFDISSDKNGYFITGYHGTLTTLNISSTISGYTIYAIDKYAFQGTSVQVVNLPDSITTLNNYAFYGITTLKKVTGRYVSSVGKYCFSGDFNLETVDIPYIQTVAAYAFQNCLALTELDLTYAQTINENAFKGLTLTTLYLGGLLSTFSSTQSEFSVETLYAYTGLSSSLDSTMQKFATKIISTNGETIYQGNSRYVVASGDQVDINISLSMKYYSYGVYGLRKVNSDGSYTYISSSGYVSSSLSSGDDDEYYITTTVKTSYTTSSMGFHGSSTSQTVSLDTGTYEMYSIIADVFGYLEFYLENYSGYSVANFLLDDLYIIYYNVSLVEYYGSYYLGDCIQNNTVDENYCLLMSSTLEIVDSDTATHSIAIGSDEDFEIYVDGALVEDGFVFYEGVEYEVTIKTESGYYLDGIEVCGYTFVTDDSSSSCTFNITFESDSVSITGVDIETQGTTQDQDYDVSVSAVKTEMDELNLDITLDTGISITVSDGTDTNEISTSATLTYARGSSITIEIAVLTGYYISCVTINGEEYNLIDNTIVIDYVKEPYDIVIESGGIYNTVTVKAGYGGIVSYQGFSSINESSNEYTQEVLYNTTVKFSFLNDGEHEVESITVNGEIYDLGSSNVVELVIMEDTEIIVSFKQVFTSIFGDDEVIIITFFGIGIGILVVLFVSKLALYLYRKNKKKKNMFHA